MPTSKDEYLFGTVCDRAECKRVKQAFLDEFKRFWAAASLPVDGPGSGRPSAWSPDGRITSCGALDGDGQVDYPTPKTVEILADGGQVEDGTERPTLDDVGESTALRVYDAQFEGCHDVNADEDPRPCLSFYVMTDLGIASLRSAFNDGFGNEAHRLCIPNLGEIPERERESIGRHADQKTLDLVDADALPSQRDPFGKDPVTGLPIQITGFGFDVKPWGERECARCGRPCDTTSADRVPDGFVHTDCNPSNWGDASLEAFTDGGRTLSPDTGRSEGVSDE